MVSVETQIGHLVEAVEYMFTDSTRWVIATVDGVRWDFVDIEQDLVDISRFVLAWIELGNTPAPCSTGRKMPVGLGARGA